MRPLFMRRQSGFTPFFPSRTVVVVAIGFCFVFGCSRFDEGDPRVRVERAKLRAEQGDSEAQFTLGRLCEKGDAENGIPKSPAKAANWYERAASQGHPQAKVYLGVLYENGSGVGRDLAKAVNWYRSAAEQEYPKAQVYLGEMYERGVGVKQDYAEAYKWFYLAANHGWKEGVACQQSLARWMTPEQFAAAKRRISAFVPHKSSARSVAH